MPKPPQQISQQAIEEFKAIYQQEFGVALSDDDAQEMAVRLLQLFAILAQSPNERASQSQSPSGI
jgi:hypothetical protein